MTAWVTTQICYGQAFQLLHVQSNKYVTCAEGLDGGPAAVAAAPDEGGGESADRVAVRLLRGGIDSLFRIASPHGAKQDSDPVLRGDVVAIVPVLTPKVTSGLG